VILVDTSVWVDYFRGTDSRQTAKLDSLLGAEPLAIGDIVLTEVLQGVDGAGIANSSKRARCSPRWTSFRSEARTSQSRPRATFGGCARSA